MKIPVVGLLFAALGSTVAFGQASTTASRTFDLQAGGGFSYVRSDYSGSYKGGALYTTLDFSPHFGAEFEFHQADSPKNPTYERTYEFGARYHRTYGRFEPFAKVAYGRGVFNFVDYFTDPTTGKTTPKVVANLAYNEIAFGGGTDYRLLPWLNLRGEYEYQTWHSFPPNGLTPQVITIGVAYHFPGGLEKGRRFK